MKNSSSVQLNDLEVLSIRDLRKMLTTKSNYAGLVVDRAKLYGFELTKFAVYNAVQINGGANEDVIKKVFISIIKEREAKLAEIV